jgi:hypothetical protein
MRTGKLVSFDAERQDKTLRLSETMYLKLHNRISKVCILFAATLVLPVLAYADRDDG